jgi:DNA-binding CsgD family transcriptional regulator
MSETLELLTARERECLRLVHAHHNSKQIARTLGIKPGTVDKHCENAARKLAVENRVAAALVLAAVEGPPNDSQYEGIAMATTVAFGPVGAAERTPHDTSRRHDPAHKLARNGSHPSDDGDHGNEAADDPAFGGGHAQAGPVPDAWRGDDRTVLHRVRDVGRQVQSFDSGHGRLGSILIVFGVAAVAVWIVTALAGAEQFAFLLQTLRYGG